MSKLAEKLLANKSAAQKIKSKMAKKTGFAGMFDKPEPSPLDNPDLPYDETLENDGKVELSETLKLFREQAKAERRVFEDTTDTEYWFAVCFQSRAQKDAFLQQIGWGEVLADKYIDGLEAAELMGIELPVAGNQFVPSQPKFTEIPTINAPISNEIIENIRKGGATSE